MAYYPALQARLATLPTPKMMRLDGSGRAVEVTVNADTNHGLRARVDSILASIEDATFTGAADKPVVCGLYRHYVVHLGSAIDAAAPQGLSESYIGMRNSAGEREGQGAVYKADGEKYVGHWQNGKASGFGEYNWPTGNAFQGAFVEGYRTGAYKRSNSGA